MMFLFAVPVMLAFGIVFRAAHGRHAKRCVSAAESLRLLRVPVAAVSSSTSASLLNIGVDTGWFSYVPLSGPAYSPGKRVDVWAQMISFTEISALVAAIQIIVTAFKMRAPGMTLNRVPLFVWAMVVTVVHGDLRDAVGDGCGSSCCPLTG